MLNGTFWARSSVLRRHTSATAMLLAAQSVRLTCVTKGATMSFCSHGVLHRYPCSESRTKDFPFAPLSYQCFSVYIMFSFTRWILFPVGPSVLYPGLYISQAERFCIAPDLNTT
jgi:hypothetical protein